MMRSRNAAVGAALLTGAVAAGVGHLRLRIQLAAARADAFRDSLTLLANRRHIEAELARRAAGTEPYALVLLDLDGFKVVNDTHGHAAGDVVLIETAIRLGDVIDPGTALVGRLGGDEFVVIASSPAGAFSWLLAQDVLKAMRRPIDVGGDERVTVTASVGLLHGLPGDDVRAVMRSADIAVYRAKAAGGNTAVEFDSINALIAVDDERPTMRTRDMHPQRVPSEHGVVLAR